ncbi:hypothetical protein HID58_083773 [Brassica napus]|uniref:Helicase C-terminal domain-containing protein n=1 Tax=Brassica napus TaxID=3708 RepID=A0ABQ7YG50_BRANA|nr:hypothetical protein HID58_083773 [Brassica napus]
MDAREENEDPMEMQDDQQMEENNNQDEEMQDVDTRSESCVSLSDDEEQLLMGHDDELDLESIIMQKPLSEEEIDELISELVGVESKAAEAQKAIEEESLAKVEGEVREKLARTLRGVELDKSVSAEMTTFKDVWEETLDNLEVESANLLEQLDGAGVELPKLYKMIESQAPSRCHTEFWKKRTHWVGTQVTEETVESLANAETFLHTHRPVRKRHGILLEEGASGFLEKKFADDGVKESLAGPSELDWSSLNKVFTEKKDEAVSFGSKNWASVYSASTPQQAAAMGFEFPGVNEVEEIEEIDAVLEGTFFADAMENERELALAEEQKKNYKRVREDDDINIDRQLRLHLNRKRRKTRSKQVIRHEAENSDDESACLYENNTVPNRASIVEKQRTMSGLQDEVDGYLHEDWWVDSLDKTNYKDSDYSGKMILLLDILTMCADVGDKALVFSQSIPTLDLIELYLSRLPRNGKQGKFWKKGKDWYRIDGKTVSSERQKLVDRFNEPENKRVKCTLISTRAESLGINLYAANRVIIVDGSWNPTYDLQAIYGAWRYGQKKPVFAYRLMARGTIEEKIYKPQVTKEGRAARVVDRQQVHRNISKEEMLHLFEFDEAEDSQNTSQKVGCCSDKMMENLLQRHNPNLHEHETLLKENEEEKLTKEEKDKAREVYRRAFEWEGVQRVAPELQKPLPSPQTVPPRLPKRFNRSRFVIRNCTRTAHQRTFIAQGRKVGSSTVCGECGLVLTWEDVTTPAHKIDYF